MFQGRDQEERVSLRASRQQLCQAALERTFQGDFTQIVMNIRLCQPWQTNLGAQTMGEKLFFQNCDRIVVEECFKWPERADKQNSRGLMPSSEFRNHVHRGPINPL